MKLDHLTIAFSLLLPKSAAAWNHITGQELLGTVEDGNGPILIAYVLPEEANSQAFEREWLSVQETPGDGKVVSVDCSAEEEVCREAGVSSFPAIRLRRPDGRRTRYRGPRSAASVKAFLHRMSRPAVSHVTAENLTKFHPIDEVVFIGHFGPGDDHLRQNFMTVAEENHDRYSFAISVAQQSGQVRPSVECYNNPDGVKRVATEFPSPASIESSVKRCAALLIPEMTRRNELSFYETSKSIVHYFVRSEKEREEYVREMRPLASKYEEYLHFVTTDADEYPDAAEMMGHKRGSQGLSVQNPNSGDVYPYTRKDTITASSVEAFLGDIIQGKTKAWKPAAGHDEL